MLKGIKNSSFYMQNGLTDYEAMHRYGYDCADFQGLMSLNGKYHTVSEDEMCIMLKDELERAEKYQISFSQVHSIWPVDDTDEKKRTANLLAAKRAVIGASVLKSKNLVCHPVMPFGYNVEPDSAEVYRINREFFSELARFAKPYGVNVCIENMPFKNNALSYTAALCDFVKDIDMDNFGICLDTGHSIILKEDIGDMIRRIGKKLFALHIHDNLGASDAHRFPFTGVIDWQAFAKALGEIEFDGCLSLETGCNHSAPDGIRDALNNALFETLVEIEKICKDV